MILRYVYAYRNGSKQLVGCVCRTDEGKLGYSAVHPKDRRELTKKLARTIALGRAEKCEIFFNLWGTFKCRLNHSNEEVVPARIIPHLAALAALGPR